MTAPVPLSFSHVGLFVTDLASTLDFYTALLGFRVTDRGGPGFQPMATWRAALAEALGAGP